MRAGVLSDMKDVEPVILEEIFAFHPFIGENSKAHGLRF